MSRQAKSPPLARMACLALTLALACLGGSLWACPFCNSIKMTLAEEISQAEVAVLAEVVNQPPTAEKIAGADADDLPLAAADSAEAEFKIKKVLKGADALGKTRRIRTLYFGQQPEGTLFLILGVDPKNIAWSTPTALSKRAADYVSNLNDLPPSGVDRLDFFQKYFEDEDRILAEDAYEEFAKASYNDVKQLRGRMDRAKLLDWIRDPNVAATRRRLYLTMLGICGTGQDADMLEAMLKGDDRRARAALDAMIACYVTLKGPAAMDLVDQLFFKDSKAEYTSSYSAIMAVRFLDQESEVVPRERLTQSLRHLLDRPQLADLVIPDLARWQDWSVMDKLVTLFKEATEENSWVRVPVINYLMACPHPEAKRHLDELGKIDPDAVKRASFFLPLAGSKRPAGKPAEAGQDGAADAAADPKAQNSDGTQEASEEKDSQEQKAAGPTADDEQADDEQAGVQEAGVEGNLQSAAGEIPAAPHDIALADSESAGQTTASGAGEATTVAVANTAADGKPPTDERAVLDSQAVLDGEAELNNEAKAPPPSVEPVHAASQASLPGQGRASPAADPPSSASVDSADHAQPLGPDAAADARRPSPSVPAGAASRLVVVLASVGAAGALLLLMLTILTGNRRRPAA